MFDFKPIPFTGQGLNNYDSIAWTTYTYCAWIDKGNTKIDKKIAFESYSPTHIVCKECEGCK